MKKWLLITIAVLLLGTLAAAEEYRIEAYEIYHTDLDGDGTIECWGWEDTENEAGETVHRLSVTADDGAGETVMHDIEETWLWFDECYYAADLDKNGTVELFATAQIGENHAKGWCLRYEDGRIVEVMFAEPEARYEAWYEGKSGYITNVDDGVVYISCYTDMLGTWYGYWMYEIGEKGRLVPMNDAWFTRDFSSYEAYDEEFIWTHASLKLQIETAYRDGDRIGVLHPGDCILITGTDHRHSADFVMRDGTTGSLYVSSKAYESFGWRVNRNTVEELQETKGYIVHLVDEETCFLMVPYAG